MTTIGYATLQIIPSLQGVSEAIEKQVQGKVVNVTIEPRVDERATEAAGKKARETVEKQTKQVKVEPKVDQAAAEKVGKQTGDAVAKGTASSTAVGQAIIGILQGSADEAGRRLGQALADNIPNNLTGLAGRIGTALRNSLPTAGAAAGTALATAIGISLNNAIGKERLDKAGQAILTGLTRAVNGANKATDLGVAIGGKIASGLTSASGVVGGAATTITNTISDVTEGVGGIKELLGGDESFAAPALDGFNDALGKATPLLNAVTGASTLAAAGAQTISTAVGLASKAQLLWNAALIANPIGLIVAAITAVVAGLVLFFTKTELGRKIWQGFTDYLKIAWEAIKIAFGVAWDAIKAIWDGMVAGASAVWDGIKSAFTNVVDFVKGLPGAIAAGARGMWDGIGNAFEAMINKLKGWWNSFASALSFTTPDWLPGDPVKFSLPTFSSGGYTGTGSADQIAGVVHGGEFVINADSTRSIQNAMPGLLDYLNNRGDLPFSEGNFNPGILIDTSKVTADERPPSKSSGLAGGGGWFGDSSTNLFDLLPGYQGGGKVQLGNISGAGIATGEQQSMWDAVRGKFPGAVLTSATRSVMTEGHPDFHNAGRAIDISGPGMGAIASWIASNYPDSLELIHSPFGHNIKNGKNVGDGTAFYGAGLMAAHRNHVHWALGKSARPAASSSSDMLAAVGVDPNMPRATAEESPAASAASSGADSSSGSSVIKLANSFTGMAATVGDGIGQLNPVVTPDGKTRSLDKVGSAVGQFASGQLGSALGAFGIGDSPGWLKGLSTFANGITIGKATGPIAAAAGGGDGPAPMVPSIAPLASAATSTLSGFLGAPTAPPAPQTTYNIRTATVEDAFLASQRIEKENAAAITAVY